MVEEVLRVMKPMQRATASVCGEQQPTASKIIPTCAKLLLEMKEKNEDTPLNIKMKESVRNNLSQRYSDPVVRNLLLKIAFMDPRYKDMSFASECEAFKAREGVKGMALSIAETDREDCEKNSSDIPVSAIKTEVEEEEPAHKRRKE